MRDASRVNRSGKQFRPVRAIRGLGANVAINLGIWTLPEGFRSNQRGCRPSGLPATVAAAPGFHAPRPFRQGERRVSVKAPRWFAGAQLLHSLAVLRRPAGSPTAVRLEVKSYSLTPYLGRNAGHSNARN
jgi:hypothetical protein